MDFTANGASVTIGDGEMEKIQDNRQLSLDAGRREEIDDNEPKTLIMELYPWMQQFKKMCRSSLFQPSITSLKHLMIYYTRNVRLSVNECYTKPLRAEKLKESISESLLFFLYYYREIGEDHDRASYMDLMTDLLAMYIDMELKASKRGREHSSKIAARLSSSLHVYLGDSAEHLLDTILKVHLMTHNYQEILDPVITKIFKGIQEHPNSSIMYVRYFLGFRLWKKLNKNVAVRNQINVSALASLGTAPNDFPPFIIESVLPKVPNTQKLSTKSLLLQKFDVDKCCEDFLKFCKRDRVPNASKGELRTSPASTEPSSVPEDNDERVSIIHNNVVNVSNESQVISSLTPNSTIRETETNSQAISSSKVGSPLKLASLRKTKKSNDIVLIDLTSDNITEKVIRQKKARRKLIWLEKAVRRVSAKATTKITDSPTEDAASAAQQLGNIANLDSLCIGSPRCCEAPDMEVIIAADASVEERTTPEDGLQAGAEIDEGSTTEQPELAARIALDNSEEHRSLNDRNQLMVLETMKNSDGRKIADEGCSEVSGVAASSISNLSTLEVETVASESVNSSRTDEFFSGEKKINDRRESPSCEAEHARDSAFENNVSPEARPEPVQLAIKTEHVSDETHEIMNEEMVSMCEEQPSTDLASRVPLEIGCNEEIPSAGDSSGKIRETEFQDNIDGLSLLASVSQRVSHLTTTPNSPSRVPPANGELIKVKNYASLANSSAVDEPVTSSDALPLATFCGNNSTEANVINNRVVVSIYPEDVMDKVAYQVEVTSTGDIDPYDNGCEETEINGAVAFPLNGEEPCRNNQPQAASVVSAESTTQAAEKDDTNVILNGETVVLFQKSPNSNLYIINKAVENRDHVSEDVSAGIRDIAEHANETVAFTYEYPYDSVYRNQSSLPYDLTQYGREVSAESRRGKKVIVGGGVGGDSAAEANKPSDAMELAKPGKNIGLPLEVIGKNATGKRKSSGNSALNRRRRIKQEFNGCGGDLPNHIAPNYGIQECSQEHVDAARSAIHIPATHSSPLSSIYTTYTGGAELYLPCHKNCNSMACGGLPVSSKGSAGTKGHCSCLNCTYGIVAHCGECIMPSNETRGSAIDGSSYYLPIHSAVQTSAVQDCGGQDSLVKIFDEKLVCKLEQTMLNGKPLENVGVKCEPKEIYRAELDNKLPLKKRFKAMMSVSFEEMSIKREKAQSYPGTPMLSIAALDSPDALQPPTSNNSLDLSSQERGDTHSEMIRRDYRKEMTTPSSTANGGRSRKSAGGAERKRKRRTLADNVDEGSYQKISKTPAKHKETTATTVIVAKRVTATPNKPQARPSEKVKEPEAAATPAAVLAKNSTRQTRSSKRNMPKVNYIYADADSEWNPSGGGSKRKRKKTSR